MKESKILFYSDQHLRLYGSYIGYNVSDENGYTKELNNILNGFIFISNLIQIHQPDAVIGLGDLYDSTNYQSAQVIDATHEALGAVKEVCNLVGSRHLLIPGNHDIFSEMHNINSIKTLSNYAELYFEPGVVDVNGLKIGLVPATDNPGKAYENLLMIHDQSDMIGTHLDFSGAQYETGRTSESEVVFQSKVPIVSGDIHYAQKIGNVRYVGSLVQNKFSTYEFDASGYALLYDRKQQNFEWIRNNFSKHYVKFRYDGSQSLSGIDPEKYILKVITELPREQIDIDFEGYDYMYSKIVESEKMKTQFESISAINPERILRSHVEKDRPDALEALNDVGI